MKQTLRKILAVLVIFSIVLSVGIVAFSGSAATAFVFEDTFEDGNLNNWKNVTGSGTVANGVYNMPLNKSNWVTVAGASALKDYSVEADVTILDTDENSTSNTVYAGIVGRTTSIGANGYEFTLRFNKTADTPELGVGLFRRGTVNGQSQGFIKETNLKNYFSLAQTQDIYGTYRLKMEFEGSAIRCYVNGTLVINATDSNYKAGTAGIRCGVYDAKFDNFKFSEPQPAASSSQVTSTPVSSAPSSSPASSSNSSSGSGQGVLFFEDFEDALKTTDGWASAAAVENGRYTGGSIFLTKHNTIQAMSDYVVEAEVWLDSTSVTNVSNVAGVVGRYTTIGGKTGGYEVCLCYNRDTKETSIRVFDRITSAQQWITTSFDVTKAHKLTAVFAGTELRVFVDGVLAGIKPIEIRTGTVGTDRRGCSGYFDNYTVRQATQAELDATVSSAPSGSAPSSSAPSSSAPSSSAPSGSGQTFPFFEDFEDTTNTSDGWESAVAVENGQFSGGSLYLTKHNTIQAMSDYAIETEVRIDTNTATNISGNVAGVVGRYTTIGGKTGGYEVSLGFDRTNQKPFVRVYDRISENEVNGSRHSISTDITKAHKLKAVFSGTELRLFLDDTLVCIVAVEDRAGTVGLLRKGYTAYFDNFVVRQATQAEINAQLVDKQSFPFLEDFEDAVGTEYGWQTSADVENGQYSGKSSLFLTQHKIIKTMSDYVVEADIRMDTTTNTTVTGNVAAIVGRYTSAMIGGVNKTGGYEIGYGTRTDDGSAYLRIYDRLRGVQVAEVKNMPFISGQTHKLSAVFAGTELIVYIDGAFAGKFTVEARVGTAGITRTGYVAYYDNFTVRPATTEELNPPPPAAPQANANGIYYKDSFGSREDQTNGLWEQEFKFLQQGEAVLNADQGANFIMADRNFYELADYTVEAKLTLTADAPTTLSYPALSICGRVNEKKEGYEFAIRLSGGKVDMRMYDRKNAYTMGINNALSLERGKQYTLRLVMIGKTVRAYLEDVKVFEFESDVYDKGTAGLRIAGTQGTVDDFIVRQPTQAERLGLSGGATGTGPSTGGNDTNPGTGDSILYVCAALCCLVAAAVVLMRRIKHI